MPLLAEYSFEPTVADAQSVASNVKVGCAYHYHYLIINVSFLIFWNLTASAGYHLYLSIYAFPL